MAKDSHVIQVYSIVSLEEGHTQGSWCLHHPVLTLGITVVAPPSFRENLFQRHTWNTFFFFCLLYAIYPDTNTVLCQKAPQI